MEEGRKEGWKKKKKAYSKLFPARGLSIKLCFVCRCAVIILNMCNINNARIKI